MKLGASTTWSSKSMGDTGRQSWMRRLVSRNELVSTTSFTAPQDMQNEEPDTLFL